MINKILDAISNALYDEFGEEYEIYSESIEQDFKEPCFFIMCLNPSEKSFLGNRYYRKYLFDVSYFPKSKKNLNTELYEVQEKLFNCLEYLDVEGDLIRGTNSKGEIVDNKLHFFISYNAFIIKSKLEDEVMGELKNNIKVKEY